jgi:acetyl esterase/lipase
MHKRTRVGFTLLGICFLLFTLSQPNLLAQQSGPPYEIDVSTNLVYYDGPGFNPQKHILDIFAPKEVPNAPVLLFIHGGGWRTGDKNIYPFLGRAFAQQGFVTVNISYRLSPEVQHPAHIQDVARAFAWVYKNIAQYGGNPKQLFVTGHSAGGHLTALLALNKKYLQAEGLSTDLIKAALPISGIFNISNIGGADIFTSDPELRRDASPINFVSEKQSPFYLIYAQNDIPTLDTQAIDLAKLLQQKGTEAKTLNVPNRDHISIIGSIGIPGDLTTESIVKFLQDHLK